MEKLCNIFCEMLHDPILQQGRCSLATVAKEAKVSPSTVSRVINGNPRISQATRSRTLAVIQRLRYKPNERVSRFFSILNRRVHTFAYAVPSPTFAQISANNEYYLRLLNTLQKEIRQHEGHLLIADCDQDVLLDGRLRCVADGSVEGVILGGGQPEVIGQVMKTTPVVLVNYEAPVAGVDIIVPHMENTVREQMEHLWDLGHRAIACFRPTVGLWEYRRFWKIYREVAAERQFAIPAAYLVPIIFGKDEHPQAIDVFLQRVLACEQPPTAILTCDLYAIELIRQLTAKGLQVPHDISVVGYDDCAFAAASPVPLTTFRQNLEAMGEMAVRTLLDRFKHPELPARFIQIAGDFIVRNSSAKACTPPPIKPDPLRSSGDQ